MFDQIQIILQCNTIHVTRVLQSLYFMITGTNLQALIDFTRDSMNFSAAEIVLVISNKPDVQGLQRAEKAGIATKVRNYTVTLTYTVKSLLIKQPVC